MLETVGRNGQLDNFVRYELGGKRLFETHDEICYQVVSTKQNLGSYLRDHISENGYIDIPACRVALCFILWTNWMRFRMPLWNITTKKWQGLCRCGIELYLGKSTLDSPGVFNRTELAPDSWFCFFLSYDAPVPPQYFLMILGHSYYPEAWRMYRLDLSLI